MARHFIVQVTVARMRHGFDHPASAGLVARIDEMNRLAEESRGFVWRLRGSEVDGSALEEFAALWTPVDPRRVFYTLSVWESVEDLRHYVYRTDHIQMLRSADLWIEKSNLPNLALWWIGESHRPAVAESARRWRSLYNLGPTPEAFTLRHTFPEPAVG